MRLIDADKFCEYCEDYDLCKGKHIDYCPERDSLARCPTIDPESLRPKGEWLDKMVRDWHCSECGQSVPKQVRFDGYCYDDKLNFCPNCGADTREE